MLPLLRLVASSVNQGYVISLGLIDEKCPTGGLL